MTRKEILGRWLALEKGAGLVKARRVSRYLTLGSFVIFVGVGTAAALYEMPSLVTLIAGVVVGWLVAEANALKFRLDHFSIYRDYYDWAKVERDWQAETVSS